jgi:hypothetical protein
MRPWLPSIAFLLGTVSAAHAQFGPCPLNYTTCGGFTSAPSYYQSCSDTYGLGYAGVAYDCRVGHLQCNATNVQAVVQTNDDFIVSAAGSDSIPIVAHLDMTGEACVATDPGCGVSALIQAGGREDASAAPPQTLGLAMTVAPGQVFRVHCEVSASATDDLTSMIDAVLTFSLPPGASVRSCQGYTQSGTVPVARRSWGNLKVTYR